MPWASVRSYTNSTTVFTPKSGSSSAFTGSGSRTWGQDHAGFAGGLMMRPGQLKRDCQLLCKNHSQATQYPALDRCVAILVLEKVDKDPKHCSFTRVTNQNSARAISSYMVKVSLKERQSLKLPQHSQSQTNVVVWVLIARQVVLLSNPQRVLP